MTKKADILYPLAMLIVVLLAWQFLPQMFAIPTYVFPNLTEVLQATFQNNETLLPNLTTTALESILGFLIGSLIGFLVGLLMAQSNIFAKIALPYVVASQAVPIMATAPILIIWFGNGMASKVAVAAFLCFFPLCINTFRGLNEYKQIYEELFKIYGASKLDFLLKFKLANSLPFLVTGLKLNATFAVIGAIVAEFIGSDKGLGFGMLQASYNLNIPKLWSYIVVSCIFGVSLYSFIYFIEFSFFKRNKYHEKI